MHEGWYLGVDGGQSHTAAVVADAKGHILGRGIGGPSNHAEQPGGRERLRRAIAESVGGALDEMRANRTLHANDELTIANTEFASAHCAMTGGADYKEKIINSILRAHHLSIGHDAPAALAGATTCAPGVVVIAGTGSVAYGENAVGDSVRVGGWGFLFGDESGGFGIAREALRRAMRAHDGFDEPTTLAARALAKFDCPDLPTLALWYYSERIKRDHLAEFSAQVNDAAHDGDHAAKEVLFRAADSLAESAATVARRLNLPASEALVVCVGGVFRSVLMKNRFAASLETMLPGARIIAPRFDPAIGALLIAFRSAGVKITEPFLMNLSATNGDTARAKRN